VVGDIGVGKTSILKRYSYGTFNPTSLPTIGFDFQSKTIEKNGQLIKLSLWDVAGSERFQSVTKVFVKEAYGCIIVVSVEEHMEQSVK
jgi:Ras-related protein Rab-32